MTFLWLLKELFCSKFLLTLLSNFKLLFVKISLCLTGVNIGFVLLKHFSSICIFFSNSLKQLPGVICFWLVVLYDYIVDHILILFIFVYICSDLIDCLHWLVYNWLTQKRRNGWVTSKCQKTLRIIALAITSWLRVENRTQCANH